MGDADETIPKPALSRAGMERFLRDAIGGPHARPVDLSMGTLYVRRLTRFERDDVHSWSLSYLSKGDLGGRDLDDPEVNGRFVALTIFAAMRWALVDDDGKRLLETYGEALSFYNRLDAPDLEKIREAFNANQAADADDAEVTVEEGKGF